jgi:hypothetical protein
MRNVASSATTRCGRPPPESRPRTSAWRAGSVAAVPAPRWLFRFMYDRESAAWERRRDEPEHRVAVEREADALARVLQPQDLSPTSAADLAHTRLHSRVAGSRSWESTRRLEWWRLHEPEPNRTRWPRHSSCKMSVDRSDLQIRR